MTSKSACIEPLPIHTPAANLHFTFAVAHNVSDVYIYDLWNMCLCTVHTDVYEQLQVIFLHYTTTAPSV